MKVFAMIFFAVLVACVSATKIGIDLPFGLGVHVEFAALPENRRYLDEAFANHTLAELQEVSLPVPPQANYVTGLFGIPSCKLGPKIGNPICFGKCVTRGHAGGACKGKVCTCVD